MITLAHGGGGPAASEFIRDEILARFVDPALAALPDGASLPGGLIFSTDSFVVTPRFFPGGNIGKLAICGTVNDICAAGGTPRYISLALIIEEGFSREELAVILDSARTACTENNVEVVTGDTKVVPRGAADGIYINTSGVGIKNDDLTLGRNRFAVGDKVLVSGTIGEHGMAILAARHNVAGEALKSDCASILPYAVAAREAAADGVKFMRDPTRGGVGGTLCEIMEASPCGAELEESALPLSQAVKNLAGMTGIDPLFVACEGRLMLIAAADAAADILGAWRELDPNAACIGTLTAEAGKVSVRGEFGFSRMLIPPDGEQLPRIC